MQFKKALEARCKGKRVLEIGGIGYFDSHIDNDFKGWQHLTIRDVAKDLIGVDIHEGNVKLAQERGFNYTVGDIEHPETLDPQVSSQRYDVIVMVDVIEHLNSIKAALETLRDLLTEDGVLIITTPSPWSFPLIVKAALFNRVSVLPDHTAYIVKEHYLQFAERTGMKVSKIAYFTMRDMRTFRTRTFSWINQAVGTVRPLLHSHIWAEMKRG
jgi:2-polyprenyl-3-methyl-5-hydroxy-6-metoxy-1,4-benzoquinol methylase